MSRPLSATADQKITKIPEATHCGRWQRQVFAVSALLLDYRFGSIADMWLTNGSGSNGIN